MYSIALARRVAYSGIVHKTIFHIPNIHGGFATSLAHGERGLGFNSTIIGEANIYGAPPDILLSSFNVKNAQAWRERFKSFRAARKTADIIHFNFGSSLFNPPWQKHFLLELPFYPKKTPKVMTFQGSDIRMRYTPVMQESRDCELSLGHKLLNNTAGGIIPSNEVVRKRGIAKKIDRYIDRIFALNPDLLDGLSERANFLPYPFAACPVPLPKTPRRTGPLKIAHLATNRVLKGTGLIEHQLDSLAKSYDIQTRIIVKQPHKVAMEALLWADVLIDQVCLGWYGAQAVEALALGKPVLCYLNPTHRKSFLPAGNTGFVETDHINIAQTLSAFCADRTLLESYGLAGQAFVKDFHDPQKIARHVYKDWITN